MTLNLNVLAEKEGVEPPHAAQQHSLELRANTPRSLAPLSLRLRFRLTLRLLIENLNLVPRDSHGRPGRCAFFLAGSVTLLARLHAWLGG